jgi:hypothetical protein
MGRFVLFQGEQVWHNHLRSGFQANRRWGVTCERLVRHLSECNLLFYEKA